MYLESGRNNSAELEAFKQENEYWLGDFALYKVLKSYQHSLAWWFWDPEFKYRDTKALKNFLTEHEQEIDFEIWVQWQLYRQFKDVKAYACSKTVLLKGDLPILVSRDSADAWAHPEFFKLDYAAGAPPDMYAALGQR